MSRSVDIVIVGATPEAIDSAAAAASRGQRVLMVVRSRGIGLRRRLRQSLGDARAAASRVSIVTQAQVECVAGVGGVEAVLIRCGANRRRVDVNASALLDLERVIDGR
jgi:thioredoxin reductase